MSWRFKAACRDHDPDMWYPTGSTRGSRHRELASDAIKICLTCPVRRLCAGDALSTRRTNGIWGGIDLGDNAIRDLSDANREALRRIAEGVTA